MRTYNILPLARQFSKKYAQTATPPEGEEEEEINLNMVAQEVNQIIENFIDRNPLKMATTQRPFIQEAQNEKGPVVGVGFIIPFNEYDEYIRKLNNEIQKLKQKYPDITLYGYYDERDARKAKI